MLPRLGHEYSQLALGAGKQSAPLAATQKGPDSRTETVRMCLRTEHARHMVHPRRLPALPGAPTAVLAGCGAGSRPQGAQHAGDGSG